MDANRPPNCFGQHEPGDRCFCCVLEGACAFHKLQAEFYPDVAREARKFLLRNLSRAQRTMMARMARVCCPYDREHFEGYKELAHHLRSQHERRLCDPCLTRPR